ncbi:MAG: hypothetical protein IKT16_01410, partial [Desulfovibrio sp.]|nr:hypothetical protein [Desulfovibrio sp.]
MANAPEALRQQGEDEAPGRDWVSPATLACALRRERRRGGAQRLCERLALRDRLQEELDQARQDADLRLLAASAVASQRFSSTIYAADCSLPLRLVAETAREVRRRTRFHG